MNFLISNKKRQKYKKLFQEEYELKNFDNKIEVVLKKRNPSLFWKHLLEANPDMSRQNVPAWLKFDFDRWQDTSEDEQEVSKNVNVCYFWL